MYNIYEYILLYTSILSLYYRTAVLQGQAFQGESDAAKECKLSSKEIRCTFLEHLNKTLK